MFEPIQLFGNTTNQQIKNQLDTRAKLCLQVCQSNQDAYKKSICYLTAVSILLGGAIASTIVVGLPIATPILLSAAGTLTLAYMVHKCVQCKRIFVSEAPFEKVFCHILYENYISALKELKTILESQNPIATDDQNEYRNQLEIRFINRFQFLDVDPDFWHRNFLMALYCAQAREMRLKLGSCPDKTNIEALKKEVVNCGRISTSGRGLDKQELAHLVDTILNVE